MAYEKAVLSVSSEDIRGYVDGRTWAELEERGAVEAAVDFACRNMQRFLDQVDFFEEACAEGAEEALR